MANGVGEIKHSISAEHQKKTTLEEEIARIAIQGERALGQSRGVEQISEEERRQKGKKKEKRRPAEGDSESDRD